MISRERLRDLMIKSRWFRYVFNHKDCCSSLEEHNNKHLYEEAKKAVIKGEYMLLKNRVYHIHPRSIQYVYFSSHEKRLVCVVCKPKVKRFKLCDSCQERREKMFPEVPKQIQSMWLLRNKAPKV